MTTALMIVLAGATMLLLGVLGGLVLGWANKAFHVDVDPRIEQIDEALPGANCGGCTYVGCRDYAEACVEKNEAVNLCPVGGEPVAAEIAKILGVEIEQSFPFRPAIHCGAGLTERLGRSDYHGEKTCAAANLVNGIQGCTYGCMGFGDCKIACEFDAIEIVDGLSTINYDKCVGCGACAKVCPRNIVSMVPFKHSQMMVVSCSNKDFGKDVKKVCTVGCLGCKACSKKSSLLNIVDNLPHMDYDQYEPDAMDDLELALDKCPTKRLAVIGNPATGDDAGDDDIPVVTADFKTTVDDAEWRG
jgi:Na+-translocating ferredoxin:NAD+ oxidoreductase subunit B